MATSTQEHLRRLSHLLRSVGEKEITKVANRALRESVKPIVKDVKDSVDEYFPKRGGLAARVAKSTISARVSKSKNPRVTVQAKAKSRTLRDPYRADKGRIRHPVFGMAESRNPWVLQDVKPGWFTEPVTEGGKHIIPELDRNVDALIVQLESRI